MKPFQTTALLLVAILAIFCEAVLPGFRRVLGAQVDLLPALMVYAALNMGLKVVVLVSVVGGLMFDSLSANRLGVSILPLFFVGLTILMRRDLILRDQWFAQFVLGAVASAMVPVLTVLLLLTAGQSPLLGWGSLWQWTVMTVGGGVATPLIFLLLRWTNRVFGYQPIIETSFRPDREIRRGRT
jgi:cell shape-determining protein MreD